MAKSRILQLVEDLKVGGAERVIAEMAKGLDREKFAVCVWCLARGGEIADELEESGIQTKILDIQNYHNPIQAIKFVRLLRKEGPDIIHCHGYFASVIGRIAAKLSGVPALISHVHSTYWNYRKRHILMERILSFLTHKIVCCSEAVKKFVTECEGIKPSKVMVIYNGVDEEKFFLRKNSSSLKTQLGIHPEDSVVGTISSLAPHKGQADLIRAAPAVFESFPHVRILIVGDGMLREKLENLTRDLKIQDRVIFAGTRTDAAQLLSLMDVFVLPSSSREGLGLAIIEAMACEKPVVATAVGGIPEVVLNGETGFLVPPRNPDALARAIGELLHNPQKAKEMGRRGRMRFEEKFTRKKMISEIEALYQSLIAQPKMTHDETL